MAAAYMKRSIYIVFRTADCVFEASLLLTMSNLGTKFVLLIWWGASGIPRSLPGQAALPLSIFTVGFVLLVTHSDLSWERDTVLL